jgi:hypothetical protein
MPDNQLNGSTQEGKRKEKLNDTFLFEPGDSLPIARTFVAVLRSRLLLLRPVPARTTTSSGDSIVCGSARRELDELHAKRPAKNFLRLVEHGFEHAALRAYHLFRDVVAAERHSPLLLEEREPH